MKNITNVIIGKNGTGTAESVYQYGYGITLRISNVQLPTAVEVQFSLHDTRGESITRIGLAQDGVTDVIIPDSMLENGDAAEDYIIFAWVYIRNEKTGTTEYKITIPVCARAKPAPHDTPEEAELFRKAIDAVNEAADRAETAGTAAQSWAVGGTGTREGEDTDNAQYYAKRAAESAGTASENEQVVKAAEEAVDKLHSEVVKLSDETSKNAENAAQSATAAGNSATTAGASEKAATAAAQQTAADRQVTETASETAQQAATDAEETKKNVQSQVTEFNKTVEMAKQIDAALKTTVDEAKKVDGRITQTVKNAEDATSAAKSQTEAAKSATDEAEKQAAAAEQAIEMLKAQTDHITFQVDPDDGGLNIVFTE